jgi:hypothetical protein
MIQTGTTHRSFQVISTSAPDQWRSYLPASHSVFGSVEFASIVEAYRRWRPLLFVFQPGPGAVAYPLFLQALPDLPFPAAERDGWDLKSPEYTGPVCLAGAAPASAPGFQQAFGEFCQALGVVTEFAHLHPWRAALPLLKQKGITFERQIVYVDLTLSEDEIWEAHLTYACRKNILRARQRNVRVYPAQTLEDIQAFHRIYTETMQRNAAAPHYYFPLDYFLSFFTTMPDQALFMLAEHEGQIIAGTLYLHDDEDVISYLGGADQAFQNFRPTNAIVFETIRWGMRHAKRRLILGGGYRPDDGIFRFKASFSALRASFRSYRCVHRADQFQSLCRAWSAYSGRDWGGSDFFPPYRAVPALTVGA